MPLRDELQSDRRIDWNIPPDADSHECGQDEKSCVTIRPSECETKNRGNEDRQVESPLTSDYVDHDAPECCSRGQSSGKANGYVARRSGSKAKLLL